jgi:hypothetical protein
MPLRKYAQERCEDSSGVHFFQMCEDFQEYRLLKRTVEKNTWAMSSFFYDLRLTTKARFRRSHP